MAELVDAHDSKSCVLVTCGFDSHSWYREKRREFHAFFFAQALGSNKMRKDLIHHLCGFQSHHLIRLLQVQRHPVVVKDSLGNEISQAEGHQFFHVFHGICFNCGQLWICRCDFCKDIRHCNAWAALLTTEFYQ